MLIIYIILQLIIPCILGLPTENQNNEINKKKEGRSIKGYKVMEILLLYNIILSINTLSINNLTNGIGLYNGLYIDDTLNKIIEIIIYIMSIIIIKYISRDFSNDNEQLITIIIIGMISIINSNDLICLLLGLEIETLGIYILIGKESKRKNSIGIKYYILGAITSSFIYLGISIIYGVLGLTSIEEIKIIRDINSSVYQTNQDFSLEVPINIILYGLIFKLGGIPLHNYLSDIIDGIKLNINIWILGISKLTILFIINKLNILQYNISNILLIVIQLSLLLGALIGTIQKRLKRLITYSSINNIGYLLLGILININILKIGWILYLIQYILTTINILILIICLNSSTSNKEISIRGIEEIKDLKLLKDNSLRLVFLITLLSLIGIPPLLGFYGKLYLIIPILESGYINIIIILLISNIISSIYYIKLIKIIYNFENKEDKLNIRLNNKSDNSKYNLKETRDNRLGIISILLIFLPTIELQNILTI